MALVGWASVRKRSRGTQLAKALLHKSISNKLDEPLTLHPEIDPTLCAGCGSCTAVCPEGDILKLINHRAVLVSPTQCVGHGECERACPTGAISLVFGTKKRGLDIPRISGDYETNIPGVYITGELGGMGLIRNAVRQGVAAVNHAVQTLNRASLKTAAISGQSIYDFVIVGAGPAGLAACLAAQQAKKTYLCIEQNSFGGTINNFPRQKIVMSQPAELPGYGKMKFRNNQVSKEDLLEIWNEIRARFGLKIQEQTRFEGFTPESGGFAVMTNQGAIRARKVILAMGVRGSPRRLGLPNEDLPKVTYNLIEPDQYKSTQVAIVGGGNSAVEAAIALANSKLSNQVILLVRGAGFDRCNEENQRRVNQLAGEGRVQILFNSQVKEIHPQQLVIQCGEGLKKISNQYLFVFAGAEMPSKFLMSLGIAIDKKFGESLKKAVA